MRALEHDVLSDHVRLTDVGRRVGPWAENAIFIILVLIQSSSMVSLPTKLAGGVLPGLGLVWAVAIGLCLVFAFLSPLKTLKGLIYALPFIGLGVWATASNLWTVTPYETLRGTILYITSTAFAVAIATRFSWERLISLLAWTLNALVILSVVLALAVPSIGQMQGELAGAWSGVWLEKQALGFYACLALLSALAMIWRGPRYWGWWGAIVFCIIAIVGSKGVTALAMTAIATVVGLWLRLFYRDFAAKLTGGWLAAVALIAAVPALSGAFDVALRVSGKGTDLSGRREIWEGVRTVADMRPYNGWGFQSIWRTKDDMTSPLHWILERADFVPANAHSSWLDIYLQLGQPGVILLGICMIWVWASLVFRAGVNNLYLAFSGAVFAAITFISFSETNLAMPMDLQWTLVCMLSTKLFLTQPETAQPRRKPIAPTDTADGEADQWFTYDDGEL